MKNLTLHKKFTHHSFQSIAETQKAKILFYLLAPLFGASLILGVLGIIRTRSLDNGIGVSLLCAAFFAFLLGQIYKGKLKFPSYLIPAIIILATTAAAIDDGQLAPRHITSLFLAIIIASVLLNELAIILFGIISLIPITLIPYLAGQDLLSEPQFESLVTRLSIIVGVWLVAIFLLRFAVKSIQESAKSAQKNSEKLKVQNEELKQIHHQLETRSAELFRLNAELQEEITQREHVTHELIQSQEFSHHILNTIPDLILHIQDNLLITDIKLSTVDPTHPIFEIQEGCKGENLRDLLPQTIQDKWAYQIKQAIELNKETFLEHQAESPHGDAATYEGRILPSSDKEAILILRDKTIQKQKDLADQRSKKLESIGVLAGGIAHDFNNLLTGILGQTSLAKVKLERDLDPTKHIERASLAAQRAADLTRQLLAYSGKGQFLIESININQFIRESVFLLETLFPKNVQLDIRYSNIESAIKADKGQIQQVILNLLINAVDATKQSEPSIHSPKIDLIIEQLELTGQEEFGFIDEQPKAGQYVAISIEDNGPGISQDVRTRIFEPYFSTKGLGRGLGLSAILGIIKGLDGGIKLESSEGAGTCFTVLIPRFQPTQLENDSNFEGTVIESVGEVLIIDDEKPVRDVASEICSFIGFDVLCAEDGVEGLSLFKSNQENISFVLLDLQMPKMDGGETLKQIRAINTNVKIILSSGFSEIDFFYNNEDNNLTFIQKPYTFDELQKTIQDFSLLPK